MTKLGPQYLLSLDDDVLCGARPLAEHDVRSLDRGLKSDANQHLYNAILTIHDALCGVINGFYSWSIVKAYYASFYCVQAYNELAGVCIFYVGKKPFICYAKAGRLIERARFPSDVRGSHQIARELFKREFPDNFFLSQEIDGKNAIEWQQGWREEVNYRARSFAEPNVPICLQQCSRLGTRKTINLYFGDDGYQYEFDPFHAMLALPMRLFRQTIKEFQVNLEEIIDGERKRFLNNTLRDKGGPVQIVPILERFLA